MTSESTPRSIDEYIASVDVEGQARLANIRDGIREVAPDTTECISYKMPAFKHGRHFIYVGVFKKHIGIYPLVKNDKAPINLWNCGLFGRKTMYCNGS